MEIEAKFQIPDEGTFQRLLGADTLAGFTFGAVGITELSDRYLETRDGAIRAGGYACRLRQADGLMLATVKGLGGASGAIHRREEHEVELPEPQLPQRWPPGTARDTILRLCGGKELSALFEVKQTRHSRSLYDGDRLVAEVCLDRVCISRGNTASATFLELEAELLADGQEEDLEQIGTGLQGLWGLIPEIRSKYERGLALTDLGMAGSPLSFKG